MARMLGLDNQVHDDPRWLFLRLKHIHRNFAKAGVPILERDRASGLWRILRAVHSFAELFELSHFDPGRRVKASRLEPMQSRRGHRRFMSLLGIIESGLTGSRACHVDPVEREPDAGVSRIVDEVKSRRPRRLQRLGHHLDVL